MPWAKGGSFPQWYVDELNKILKHNEHLCFDNEVVRCFKGWDKYEGAKILIVGGGPSTNSVPWNPANYDYVWSMNHFFLHPTLFNTEVDLVALSAEVNLENPELVKYLSKFPDTTILFDYHQKWLKENDSVQKFSQQHNCGVFHTRFFSILGYGIRMMILGASIKAAQMDFVGMDGITKTMVKLGKSDHAFQGTKSIIPEYISRFAMEYRMFWEYILEKYPNTKFISLDKENPNHEKVR